jgi:glycine betaine/choline ABC-type transport system substrate-binding protein
MSLDTAPPGRQTWFRALRRSFDPRLRGLFALLAAMVLALGVAACGDDDDDDSGDDTGGEETALIESNPDNEGIELTVGSKNFDEQFILGEIYAQALEAAGYTVSTELNLGSEVIAKRALESGEIDAYPEYTSTTLTSLYKVAPEDVPGDATEAYELANAELEADGLVAFPPTPFTSANAVGLLTETADELGVATISDLEGASEDLVLYGTTECRQRIDCLLGLEENYGLQFKDFNSVDPELRYEVLDNGDADLSILFTTDGQLFVDPETYTILEDDQQLLPAGNVIVTASQEAVDEAGEDFGATIEKVQENLTLEVMQELNARVSLDREDPADVAADYLSASGYTQ